MENMETLASHKFSSRGPDNLKIDQIYIYTYKKFYIKLEKLNLSLGSKDGLPEFLVEAKLTFRI